MEQRIGPNIQPLQGAAVDPAFVPGITGPRPAAPKDAEPAETTEEAVSQETASEKRSVSKAPASKTPASKDEAPEEEPEKSSAQKPSGGKPAAEDSSDDEPSDDEPSDNEPSDNELSDKSDESPDGGPVFEAADRRARIIADHSGVRLTLDDQEAEFRWDEIGAVETESPRFGKRFTITVHTPDRRWYPLEIEATSRSSFKEWETSLDEVLDTYFEDDEAAEPAEESAP